MKIKTKRSIDSDLIRNLCIRNHWYTNGTNKEYNELFNMCSKENITDLQLFKIATNIYNHSRFDNYIYANKNDMITSIMFAINKKICVTTYEIIE